MPNSNSSSSMQNIARGEASFIRQNFCLQRIIGGLGPSGEVLSIRDLERIRAEGPEERIEKLNLTSE